MTKQQKRLHSDAIVNMVLPVEDIDPHPQNYNQHPPGQISQLAKSHVSFGQYRSIVVWKRPGGRYTQVAGHGYLEAAKGEGLQEVRCDVLPEDTPQDTIEAILVADNLHAHNSTPDTDILVELLQRQSDAGYDLASIGTDDETLRQMLQDMGDSYLGGGSEEENQDVEIEPDEQQTRVKAGDVWQLGRHVIACMNATDPITYERLTKDKNITFVWSDPPYGISIVTTNESVGGGEEYDIPFGGVKKSRGDVGGGASHMRKTGKPYIAEKKDNSGSIGGKNPPGSKNNLKIAPKIDVGKYAPIIGDETTNTAITSSQLCLRYFSHATQVWWGANYYAHALPPSSCWIVWDKENTGNFADAELAWCSDKSAVRIFKHMWNGLMKDSEKGQRRVHPTQKPCALFCWAAEKYGKSGDVIFDPFLGSGISVIGAEMLNDDRAVIGCELSPEYIDIIISRWEKHTGQTATLLQRLDDARQGYIAYEQ